MPTSQTTILIVDDEDLFRSSTADALEAACPDYKILQAEDGSEAARKGP